MHIAIHSNCIEVLVEASLTPFLVVSPNSEAFPSPRVRCRQGRFNEHVFCVLGERPSIRRHMKSTPQLPLQLPSECRV